jgi:chromosome segregation ATPase
MRQCLHAGVHVRLHMLYLRKRASPETPFVQGNMESKVIALDEECQDVSKALLKLQQDQLHGFGRIKEALEQAKTDRESQRQRRKREHQAQLQASASKLEEALQGVQEATTLVAAKEEEICKLTRELDNRAVSLLERDASLVARDGEATRLRNDLESEKCSVLQLNQEIAVLKKELESAQGIGKSADAELKTAVNDRLELEAALQSSERILADRDAALLAREEQLLEVRRAWADKDGAHELAMSQKDALLATKDCELAAALGDAYEKGEALRKANENGAASQASLNAVQERLDQVTSEYATLLEEFAARERVVSKMGSELETIGKTYGELREVHKSLQEAHANLQLAHATAQEEGSRSMDEIVVLRQKVGAHVVRLDDESKQLDARAAHVQAAALMLANSTAACQQILEEMRGVEVACAQARLKWEMKRDASTAALLHDIPHVARLLNGALDMVRCDFEAALEAAKARSSTLNAEFSRKAATEAVLLDEREALRKALGKVQDDVAEQTRVLDQLVADKKALHEALVECKTDAEMAAQQHAKEKQGLEEEVARQCIGLDAACRDVRDQLRSLELVCQNKIALVASRAREYRTQREQEMFYAAEQHVREKQLLTEECGRQRGSLDATCKAKCASMELACKGKIAQMEAAAADDKARHVQQMHDRQQEHTDEVQELKKQLFAMQQERDAERQRGMQVAAEHDCMQSTVASANEREQRLSTEVQELKEKLKELKKQGHALEMLAKKLVDEVSPVSMMLTLEDVDAEDAGEEGTTPRAAFEQALLCELSSAAATMVFGRKEEVPLECFQIENMSMRCASESAVSMDVELEVRSSGGSFEELGAIFNPVSIAVDLQRQATQQNSQLLRGRITGKTKHVHVQRKHELVASLRRLRDELVVAEDGQRRAHVDAEALADRLDAANEEISRLTQELKDEMLGGVTRDAAHEAETKVVQQQLDRARQEIVEVQGELQTMRQRKTMAEEELQQLRKQHLQDVKAMREDGQALMLEKRGCAEQLALLLEQKRERDVEVLKLRDDLNSLERKHGVVVADAERAAAANEAETAKMRGELSTALASSLEVQSALQAAEARTVALDEEVRQAKVQVQQLERRLSESEARMQLEAAGFIKRMEAADRKKAELEEKLASLVQEQGTTMQGLSVQIATAEQERDRALRSMQRDLAASQAFTDTCDGKLEEVERAIHQVLETLQTAEPAVMLVVARNKPREMADKGGQVEQSQSEVRAQVGVSTPKRQIEVKLEDGVGSPGHLTKEKMPTDRSLCSKGEIGKLQGGEGDKQEAAAALERIKMEDTVRDKTECAKLLLETGSDLVQGLIGMSKDLRSIVASIAVETEEAQDDLDLVAREIDSLDDENGRLKATIESLENERKQLEYARDSAMLGAHLLEQAAAMSDDDARRHRLVVAAALKNADTASPASGASPRKDKNQITPRAKASGGEEQDGQRFPMDPARIRIPPPRPTRTASKDPLTENRPSVQSLQVPQGGKDGGGGADFAGSDFAAQVYHLMNARDSARDAKTESGWGRGGGAAKLLTLWTETLTTSPALGKRNKGVADENTGVDPALDLVKDHVRPDASGELSGRLLAEKKNVSFEALDGLMAEEDTPSRSLSHAGHERDAQERFTPSAARYSVTAPLPSPAISNADPATVIDTQADAGPTSSSSSAGSLSEEPLSTASRLTAWPTGVPGESGSESFGRLAPRIAGRASGSSRALQDRGNLDVRVGYGAGAWGKVDQMEVIVTRKRASKGVKNTIERILYPSTLPVRPYPATICENTMAGRMVSGVGDRSER